jgi:hypothetical protein
MAFKKSISFEIKGVLVRSVLSVSNSSYNCGFREGSVSFVSGWGNLTDANALLAMKYLTDLITHSILRGVRALHMSAKDNQRHFLMFLTKTGRWKISGRATHNSHYGRSVVTYAITFPFDASNASQDNLGNFTPYNVIKLYKMYDCIENVVVKDSSSGW